MRAVNRVAAGLLGLALLAGGLLVALEVALVAAGRASVLPLDEWRHDLSATTLASRWVLAVSIGLAVLGAAVLAAELRPWPPYRLLTGDDGGTVWWVSRRSVERRVAAAANAVTGVDNARAAVRGRERRWRLRMSAEARPDDRDAIQRAVRNELERLSVPRDVAVAITLRRPRRVA